MQEDTEQEEDEEAEEEEEDEEAEDDPEDYYESKWKRKKGKENRKERKRRKRLKLQEQVRVSSRNSLTLTKLCCIEIQCRSRLDRGVILTRCLCRRHIVAV